VYELTYGCTFKIATDQNIVKLEGNFFPQCSSPPVTLSSK